MKLIIYEIAGWYGAFALLLSYGLVSYGAISGESVLYQVLNITGALGLLTIAFAKKVYQSVTINIIWALIGIFALLKLFF
ncbi:MAG: hypothetical protein AABW92_02360 [Nanoarchaeota archaeon]